MAMCFQLPRAKVIAVTLGPDGVGVISLIDQVVGVLAQICTFTIPLAAMKFLSAAHSEDQQSFVGLYAAFLRALLVLSLAGTACGIALLIWWPAVLGHELARYTAVSVLALLAIPTTNLTALLTSAMAASRHTHAAAAYGAYNAAALALICTVGALLAGLFGYYLGNLIASAAVVVAGLWYLYRIEKLSVSAGEVSLWREITRRPDVISFSGSFYLISFALPAAYLIARYAVLNAEGLEGVGLLQSAMALSLALFTVMRLSNNVYLLPAMSRVGDAREKFGAAVEYLRTFSVMIAIVAVPMVLFPDWWLPLLYSRRFLDAAPYVYIFVLAQTLQLLAGIVLGGLLLGLGHIRTQVWVTLSGLASLAVIAWLLVPRCGIAGVGLAFLFDGLLIFILAAWRLWSLHRLPIARAMGFLPVGAVLLIACCGAFAQRFPSDTASNILIKGAICLFLTFVGVTTLRHKDGSFAWWNRSFQ
jgi:O-antigen/teichoic acid export membrane protein